MNTEVGCIGSILCSTEVFRAYMHRESRKSPSPNASCLRACVRGTSPYIVTCRDSDVTAYSSPSLSNNSCRQPTGEL